MSYFGHIASGYNSSEYPIGVVDTYQKFQGAATVLGLYNQFDMPTDGRLRYTKDTAVDAYVTASIVLSGGTAILNPLATVAIAKNGVVDATTEIRQTVVYQVTYGLAPHGLISLVQNDYLEVWIKFDGSTAYTPIKSSVIAVAT